MRRNSYSHAHDDASARELGIVLPCQYWDRHRSPEVHLIAAVLEEALLCIVAAHRRRRRKEFSDAWTWMWSDTRDWPFAFANVCEVLGLECAAVRASVRRLVAGQHRKTTISSIAERSVGGGRG